MTEAFVEDVGNERTYRVFEEQDSYGCREHVEVPTETLLRWQHAQRAWDAAQVEMRATYEASAALTASIEQVESDMEHEQWAAERAVHEAEAATAEATAEVLDGPRQFVVVELRKWAYDGRGSTFVSRVIHRESCTSLAIARRPDSEGERKPHCFGGPIRKPQAVGLIGNPLEYGSAAHPCQRCCRDLTQESAKT